MLRSSWRGYEVALNQPDLIIKMLSILSLWGRENLGRLGWFVSDPHSYEWWGGFKDPFEIGVSTILVQLSRWEAVDKAITRLRENKLLDPYVLAEVPQNEIKELIKGVGFHESKSRTLKEFSLLIVRRGGWGAFINRDLDEVRKDLIRIKGIGYETADTILLFAGNKLVLPLSRLARRVLSRVGINLPASYVRAQQILEELIPRDLGCYKLFHAALVSISKKYCRSKKPLCAKCPLQTICGFPAKHLKT